MSAREEIAELLQADLACAGKDLEMLRELETFLEPMKHHPLVRKALRRISHRVIFLETGVCSSKRRKQ
jgi:hypothetical protein